MAKLVVNIKGQSEEFGLTDDARDIGGNDYLTVSNGNKKQYARLGSEPTSLVVIKNNQKLYVQKDAIGFSDKSYFIPKFRRDEIFDTYFPKGVYTAENGSNQFSIVKSGVYKVIIQSYSAYNTTNYFYVTVVKDGEYVINKGTFTNEKSLTLKIKRLKD